jgi:hypothetical protein
LNEREEKRILKRGVRETRNGRANGERMGENGTGNGREWERMGENGENREQ